MKRLLVLAVVMTGFLSVMNGQTYYNMWRGSGTSGKPEWIANLAMRTYNAATGIEFTTGNNCRGFVNGSGRWGFINPANPMAPVSLSNVINGINNLTLGVQGWACAEGVSVRVLSDRVTTTLDLISANGGSSIISNGDSQGLHIRLLQEIKYICMTRSISISTFGRVLDRAGTMIRLSIIRTIKCSV